MSDVTTAGGELVDMMRARTHTDVAPPGLMTTVGRWGRPRGWQYHLQVLLHPTNMLILLVLAGVSLMAGAAWLIPIGLGLDGVIAHGIARLGAYRRLVDRDLEESDRLRLRHRLAELLAAVGPAHRAELEGLIRLHGEMRQRQGRALELVEQHIEPGRLLASYLRLALIHRQWQTAQETVSRGALGAALDRVEEMLTRAEHDPLARALEQRRKVLSRRAALWDRIDERLRVIRQQLSLIKDLVELLHAHLSTMAAPDEAGEVIDSCLEELALCEPEIRSLVELEELPAPALAAECSSRLASAAPM